MVNIIQSSAQSDHSNIKLHLLLNFMAHHMNISLKFI